MGNVLNSMNVDDLVNAFLLIEVKEQKALAELRAARRELVDLQVDGLLADPGDDVSSGQVGLFEEIEELCVNKGSCGNRRKDSKEIKRLLERSLDLESQVGACAIGRERIVGRLRSALPAWAESEQRRIDMEVYPAIAKDREQILGEYIAVLARAIALKEQLSGTLGQSYHRTFSEVVSYLRDIDGSPNGAKKVNLLLGQVTREREGMAGKESVDERRTAAHKHKEHCRLILDDPEKAVEDYLRAAGARAYQLKPEPELPTEKGILDAGGWVEKDPMGRFTAAQLMGYEEIPPPRIEQPKCLREGCEYRDTEHGRFCQHCGEPSPREETPSQAPQTRPICPNGNHDWFGGVCILCGYTQTAARMAPR